MCPSQDWQSLNFIVFLCICFFNPKRFRKYLLQCCLLSNSYELSDCSAPLRLTTILLSYKYSFIDPSRQLEQSFEKHPGCDLRFFVRASILPRFVSLSVLGQLTMRNQIISRRKTVSFGPIALPTTGQMILNSTRETTDRSAQKLVRNQSPECHKCPTRRFNALNGENYKVALRNL